MFNLKEKLEQDFSNKNRPEENIIYRNSEYTNNKTTSYILYTQNQITDNNKSENYMLQKTPRIYNNTIDKKKLNEILSQNTGKSIEEVARDTERDNWMTAEEALNYGIIDTVVKNR